MMQQTGERSFLVIMCFFMLLPFAVRAEEFLPKIASSSVCADQYVLALAKPEQIVGLSFQAKEENISFYSKRAKAINAKTLIPNAESLLALRPDILVTDNFREDYTEKMLRKYGVKIVRLPFAETVEDAINSLLIVGKELNRYSEAKSLVEDAQKRLEAIILKNHKKSKSALYLFPGGSTAGSKTYVGDVLEKAGLSDFNEQRGVYGWSKIGLEEIVFFNPDLLITSFFDLPYQSLQDYFKFSASYKLLMSKTQNINTPSKFWACPSWLLVNAVEHISENKHKIEKLEKKGGK